MAHYKGAAKEAGRAAHLIKKRQRQEEELANRKRKIEEEMSVGTISNKFATHYDAVEQQLKSDTVGLVTLDEMRAKQEVMVKEREKQLAINAEESRLKSKQEEENKRKQKKQKIALSFDPDEDEEDEDSEEEEEVEIKPKKRLGKNPDVDTSFLPDRDREAEDAMMRTQLATEWRDKQEKLKNEEIEITYSYWDGSGHRRQVRMRKGNSIQQFLQRCLEGLRKDYHELRIVSVDQLMYVKEDLIIPHHYTFYDFIVTQARGKSGALFSFDVHDDVRITNDATVEKDESHAGKVLLRSWYERNKHIFPASRWEPFDPEKKWDNYSISDKNAVKITVK